ncbi:MAG: Maf family nucleotide pyrophosphatase [Proteobacteria bacterium]|nr:Maf family nucleotide pyrophosphatase [Pseudomonadota bacterium]
MPVETKISTRYETSDGRRGLVLASSSPYRRELMDRLCLDIEQRAPNIDESRVEDEPAETLVRRLAVAKARALAWGYSHHLIIGGDQVAARDGEIVGKPLTHEAAMQQLSLASGKELTFYTGVCVLDSQTDVVRSQVIPCRVKFRELSAVQIQNYLAREKPYDCAGSFKHENLGIALFETITADDPTVLTGLPLITLVTLLNSFGVDVLNVRSCN